MVMKQAVVRMILEDDRVDVNAKGYIGRTAVIAASINGKKGSCGHITVGRQGGWECQR